MSTIERFFETCKDATHLAQFTADALKAEVKRRGIECEGKTKDEIIRVILDNNAILPPTPKVTQNITINPDITNTVLPFNGDNAIHAEKFIQNIENVAKFSGWQDNVKLAFATSKLTAIAKHWQNYEGENIKLWDEWLAAFKKKFCKAITLREWNDRVTARLQRPNETIIQYLSSKLEIIKKPPENINIPTDEKLTYLIEGVADDSDRRMLRIGAPSTIENLLDLAQKLDDDTKFKINRKQRFISSNENLRSDPKPSTYNNASSSYQNSSNTSQQKQKYICPRCKKESHPVSQCTIPCPHCNLTGHSSNSCQKKPTTSNTANKQGLCALKSICGQRGLPIVEAIINNNVNTTALIDGGAEQSIVDSSIVPRDIKITKYEGNSITLVENECIPTGQIDMSVKVGDVECTFGPIAVVHNIPVPLILGSDWRQATNITVVMEPNGDVELIKRPKPSKILNNINGCIFKTKTALLIPDSLAIQIDDKIKNFEDFMLPEHIEKFKTIVQNNVDAFSTSENQLGHCKLGQHTIELKDDIPISKSPYRYSWNDRQFINSTIEEWKKLGIAKNSKSEYASPVVIVNQPKHPSTPRRLIIDYSGINKKMIKDSYPTPHIDDVIEKLAQPDSKIFSVMDVKTAFMTVDVKPADIHKTAFITQDGLFEFLRMSFGLSNAPKCMERIMQETFRNAINTVTYMDDIGQSAPNPDIALNNFEDALKRLISSGLRISLQKCQLFSTNILFLGYTISSQGIKPDPERTSAIDRYKNFKNKTEAKSFHAFASHYRKFIKNFSNIALPIRNAYNTTPFIWTLEAAKATEILKEKLKSPPILAHFRNDCYTEIQVDASLTGLGAILVQTQNKNKVVIAYASRALADTEKHLHINEIESLAVHWAVTEKFHIYLYGLDTFNIVTDNWTTSCLLQNNKHNRKFARWLLDLQAYNYTVQHKSGKTNIVADSLSRISDHTLALLVFLTKDESRIAAAQRKDLECNDIIQVLNKSPQTRTKTDLKLTNKYIIKNGILLHKNKQDNHRIFIPKSLQLTALEICHDNGGHMDFEKTYSKLKRRYFWPNCYKDCKIYVSSCKLCLQLNNRTTKRIGFLKPRQIPNRPFDAISMDHCSFKQDTAGKKDILVIIDHTTRFLIAHALPDVSSKHVINIIEQQIINIYGPPQIIISDNASGFTSEEISSFFKQHNIQFSTSPPYWPESNGLVERAVKTITSILCKFIYEDRNDSQKLKWSKHVPEIVQMINSSKQSSLKYTPFYLIHGFEPKLRDETFLGTVECAINREYQIQQLLIDRKSAKDNLTNAQNYQKQFINVHRREVNIKIGDQVMLKTAIKTNKLDPEYEEIPYKIVEIIDDSIIKISKIDENNQEISKIVHTGQIKIYNNREQNIFSGKFKKINTNIDNNDEHDDDEFVQGSNIDSINDNIDFQNINSQSIDDSLDLSETSDDLVIRQSTRVRAPPKWWNDYNLNGTNCPGIGDVSNATTSNAS